MLILFALLVTMETISATFKHPLTLDYHMMMHYTCTTEFERQSSTNLNANLYTKPKAQNLCMHGHEKTLHIASHGKHVNHQYIVFWWEFFRLKLHAYANIQVAPRTYSSSL